MIGNPDKDIKGISGGERRRLAFGCEVILHSSKKKIQCNSALLQV